MKKYLALVKLLFIQQFKMTFNKKRASDAQSAKEGKRRAGAAAVIVLLALCLAPLLVSLAVAMYYMGKLSGGNVYLGTFLTLLCQGLVLMFGVHSIMSNVFVVRDADRLLYLPVKYHVIFLAKLTVAYLNELLTSAVSLAVVLIPFGIGANVGVGFYLMLPIALLLIPMLPMLVGTLISMPLSALVAAFGKNSAIKTILRIVIYVLIMALYMYLMYGFGFLTGSENGNILDNPEVYINDILVAMTNKLQNVMPYFHPNYMLMSSMLAAGFLNWLVGFIAALGENIALLGLVMLVSLPFYRKMLTMSVEEGGAAPKHSANRYKVKNKGIVREFILTDIKRTLRDAQVGFQSFAGIIMMPLIVVILYFFTGLSDSGDTSFLELMSIEPLYQVIAPLVILAYMTFLGCSTNVLGIYPISRENRALYVLKSLPVSFNKILLAKVLLATAVMVTSDFVSCVLIVALFGIEWYYGLAMLITMALIGFGSMCITTVLDLKQPRIGWDNFNQGLKNARNSWIAMLIALLCVFSVVLISAPFAVLYGVTNGWYFVLCMWLADLVLGVVFAVVSYKIMSSKATKYFVRIEV